MFDNLISGEEKPSPIDALLKLLDQENRDSKTFLEMKHIKFLMQSRWKLLRRMFPEKTIIERQELLMDYYKELKPSYQGSSWVKIVEGIKEMKPALVEGQLMEQVRK